MSRYWHANDQVIARFSPMELAGICYMSNTDANIYDRPYKARATCAGLLAIPRPAEEGNELKGLFFFSELVVVTNNPTGQLRQRFSLKPSQVDTFYEASLKDFPDCSLTEPLPGALCTILHGMNGEWTREARQHSAKMKGLFPYNKHLVDAGSFPRFEPTEGGFLLPVTVHEVIRSDPKALVEQLGRIHGQDMVLFRRGQRVLPKRLVETYDKK